MPDNVGNADLFLLVCDGMAGDNIGDMILICSSDDGYVSCSIDGVLLADAEMFQHDTMELPLLTCTGKHRQQRITLDKSFGLLTCAGRTGSRGSSALRLLTCDGFAVASHQANAVLHLLTCAGKTGHRASLTLNLLTCEGTSISEILCSGDMKLFLLSSTGTTPVAGSAAATAALFLLRLTGSATGVNLIQADTELPLLVSTGVFLRGELYTFDEAVQLLTCTATSYADSTCELDTTLPLLRMFSSYCSTQDRFNDYTTQHSRCA